MRSSDDPAAKAESLALVRDVIRRSLPEGFEEATSGAFTVWQVPLNRYPDTYNRKPLWYVALAPQKHYLSLYLMSVYGSTKLEKRLRDGFKAAGKKLDMGKSCISFRTPDDLALDVIGDIVAAVPMDKWIEVAKAARAGRGKGATKARKR